MSARLHKVDGVEAVHIQEQEHGFCAYVLGGDELDIAEAIWHHKPLGVHSYGSIKKEIAISNGQKKNVCFNRPIPIELSLHINVRVNNRLSSIELNKFKDHVINYCKEKFSFGCVPYTSQIYPLLLAHEKVVDVVSIQFKNSEGANVPRVLEPHQVFTLVKGKIFLGQIVEDQS